MRPARAIHVTRPLDGVLLVQIDCPPANALGAEALASLVDALRVAHGEHDVRAVVLAGREGAFCAGADLRNLAREEGRRALVERFKQACDLIEALRAPVIAAIDGHSIGGGFELALACDIRIGSEAAYFVGAAVNVGLVASVYRLPRVVGLARAKAILMTGQKVDAQTALRDGIITELHADGTLPAALQMASHIATRAPLSVESTKRLLNQALELGKHDFERVFERELEPLLASEDHREAMRAFAARETPAFRRR